MDSDEVLVMQTKNKLHVMLKSQMRNLIDFKIRKDDGSYRLLFQFMHRETTTENTIKCYDVFNSTRNIILNPSHMSEIENMKEFFLECPKRWRGKLRRAFSKTDKKRFLRRIEALNNESFEKLILTPEYIDFRDRMMEICVKNNLCYLNEVDIQ